jgi:mannose/fructose/N-acetylgalactosamine-specific phosphotransferase system component IID
MLSRIKEGIMRTFTITAAVLGLALLSGVADAKVKLKVACGADLEKFCKDVKKGEGRKACLRTRLSCSLVAPTS